MRSGWNDRHGQAAERRDHLHVSLAYLTEVETLISAQTPANLTLLQTEGRGPLTSNVGEAGGFVRTVDGLAGPDVQLHAAPVMFVDEGLALPAQHAYTFGAAVLRPTSRGKVFLRSLLPTAQPHIVHGHLTTEEDRMAFCRAMRVLLEIAGQPALARVRLGELRVPASDRDAELLEFVPRGNINAPTIMLAEKAADLIRGRPPLTAETTAVGKPDPT